MNNVFEMKQNEINFSLLAFSHSYESSWNILLDAIFNWIWISPRKLRHSQISFQSDSILLNIDEFNGIPIDGAPGKCKSLIEMLQRLSGAGNWLKWVQN